LQHPATTVFALDDIAAAHQRVQAGAEADMPIRL